MNDWQALAAQLRVDSIRCTTAAESGHPTSCMSAADLMAVLLAEGSNSAKKRSASSIACWNLPQNTSVVAI